MRERKLERHSRDDVHHQHIFLFSGTFSCVAQPCSSENHGAFKNCIVLSRVSNLTFLALCMTFL